jgi:signal transduction histidine kinase
MRLRDRAARLAGDWPGDAVIAAVLIALLLGVLAVQGLLRGTTNVLDAVSGAAACGCLIARRARPQLAAIAAAVCMATAGLSEPATGWPRSLLFLPTFLLAYSVGASASRWQSALAVVLLGAGLQIAVAQVNPFVVVVTVGPWAVGLVVRSRRRLTEQLELRGRELEAEREVFAAEAVRYERARIARELHDIVAHSVSVMVIQASAGQRLTAADPALATEAFDSISEAAGQAEAEIARLVELLDHEPQPRGDDDMRLIGELVTRAGRAGLAVGCRFTGSFAGLADEAATAAYRVVQEGLTNASKHAPGAPIEVDIAGEAAHVEVRVVNGPTVGPLSGLEHIGSGTGLAGMRERVAACGGQLSAGPAAGGGWQVIARLPCAPDHARGALER